MPINKKKNFRKVTILSKKTDVMIEVMGEVKNKNFFETMEKRIWNMSSREKWLKLGTNKKNKSNFRIGNIALDQFFCNCLRSQKAKRNYNTD